MAKASKAKNISAGVSKASKKAPDMKGPWIDVQKRTIGAKGKSKKK